MSWPPCCGGGAPSGAAGGQLSGTYPDPSVVGLTTSAAVALAVGVIADGEVLARSGAEIVGVPASGGGLTSVPGLQAAAFAASGGNSYLIDPALDTVATLANGTADGQLVAFQSSANVINGGSLAVLGSMMGGGAMGITLRTTQQTVNALRFRWNGPAAVWEPYGVDSILLTMSLPVGVGVVEVLSNANGAIERLAVPEGTMVARPLGSASLVAVPYPPPMAVGPALDEDAPGVGRANSVAWVDAGSFSVQVRFPVLADGTEGDTFGFLNTGNPGTVGFLTAAEGATFEHPVTRAMIAAPGENIFFGEARTAIVWKRVQGAWYIQSAVNVGAPTQTVSTASATIGTGVRHVLVTYAAGICTLTLPPALTAPVGSQILIQKANTGAFGVTITPDTGASINGAAADATVSPAFFATPSAAGTADPSSLFVRTGALAWRFM